MASAHDDLSRRHRALQAEHAVATNLLLRVVSELTGGVQEHNGDWILAGDDVVLHCIDISHQEVMLLQKLADPR